MKQKLVNRYTVTMWDKSTVCVEAINMVTAPGGVLALYDGTSCVMQVAAAGWIECRSSKALVTSSSKRPRKARL